MATSPFLSRAISDLTKQSNSLGRRSLSACPDLLERDSSGPSVEAQNGLQADRNLERSASSELASSSQTWLPQDAARRWREMQEARSQRSNSPKPFRAALPTIKQTKEAIKSSTVTTTGQAHSPRSVLDWRDAVALARAASAGQNLKGTALTDTFGRRHTYLRISLTERCNLRCLYCMPEEGAPLTPSSKLLTTSEIVRLAKLFVEAGVTKIRLTGGEPTLRADILDLTGQLNALPGLKAMGITSNGIVLQRNLAALKANGVELLNLSLDTLQPDRFESMTRRKGLHKVLQTIDAAIEMGFDPVKVNVVVMKGQNDDEIPDFVEQTRTKPINVRFIEYMPFDGNVWSHSKMMSYREMLAAVTQRFPQGLQPMQDARGEVAKNFKIPGFKGSVSFITSMTKAFCSDCNRLRLMADGNLKVCLFGANEVSLREAMREGVTDEDLLAIISASVDRKKAAHAGMFELSKAKNRAMVHIGG